jgi:hypothetical protein
MMTVLVVIVVIDRHIRFRDGNGSEWGGVGRDQTPQQPGSPVSEAQENFRLVLDAPTSWPANFSFLIAIILPQAQP